MSPLDLGYCVAKWANGGDGLLLENSLLVMVTSPKMTTYPFGAPHHPWPSPYRYTYMNEFELRIPTYMHHHTNWRWKTQRQRRLRTKYLPKRRPKILPKVPRPCSCKVREKKTNLDPKIPHSIPHCTVMIFFIGLVLGTCVLGYYIIRRIICKYIYLLFYFILFFIF
jgi:hypothetical protein